MNREEGYKNYESYWRLVNSIADLCEEAIEENLYAEDVVSALDRVKFHWIVDHIEIRYDLKVKKEIEDDDKDDNNFNIPDKI